MQTSGAMRREIAKSHSTVIAREGGRSSIPEAAMMESKRPRPAAQSLLSRDDRHNLRVNSSWGARCI
jgi:hypothetical protein